MSLHDARTLLEKAKAEYLRALVQVESKLRVAAAQSPDNLDAIAALQAEYVTGLNVAVPIGAHHHPLAATFPPLEQQSRYVGDARAVAEGEEV